MTDPTKPLTVLQASCHGPSVTRQTIRFATSGHIGADVVNGSELYRRHDFVERLEGWRPTMPLELPTDDFDATRGKFDCPVLVRRSLPFVDEWTRKVAHRSEPRKLAPDRWANGQTFVHPLGLIHASTMHPHAAIRGFPTSLDRVEQYALSMRRWERHLARELEADRLVVVSGDLNYPNVDGPEWCPRRMFARLGLKTWAVGVDWIAWHPRLLLLSTRTYGRAMTRQDHPWLLARYEGFRR